MPKSINFDYWIIFITAGVRAMAVSLSSVILPLYLVAIGFDTVHIALAISCGLAGCAGGTFIATFWADRVGRRKMLMILGLFMAMGGLYLACRTNYKIIFMVTFIGMVNGMGRDRGLGLTVEQAIIPQITIANDRTKIFAWYNVIVDMGNAVGALLAFAPTILRSFLGVPLISSYQAAWAFYSILCVTSALIVSKLSKNAELQETKPIQRLSASSRGKVTKFAALSAIDSFGGGFLTTSLISFWFFKRFGVDESFLGPLFFFVRIANSISHLAAAWLAKRIGLVNTMVFTHLPSSILLITVPFMPNLPIATFLFLLRELLVEMDVPTRQSYIVAIVKEQERTIAAGITNLTRSTAWALAALLAAPLMGNVAIASPLFIGPGLKIIYDLLLYRSFRHLKPPEEISG